MDADTATTAGTSGEGSGGVEWRNTIIEACRKNTEQATGRRRSFVGSRWQASLYRLSAGLITSIEREATLHLREPHRSCFRREIEDACASLGNRDVNGGWELLNAARRTALTALDPSARRLAAISTRSEIDDKLTGWRRAAARALLSPSDAIPSVDALQAAQAHLDEQSANVYRRLDIYSFVISFAFFGLVACCVAFVAAIRFDWLPQLSGDDSPLDTEAQAVGIALLGTLGALLSVALSWSTGRRGKLPELWEGVTANLLRPAVGAASALALVLVLDADMVPGVEPTGTQFYVWALAAGFSERLLRKTIDGVASTIKSSPSATTRSDDRG